MPLTRESALSVTPFLSLGGKDWIKYEMSKMCSDIKIWKNSQLCFSQGKYNKILKEIGHIRFPNLTNIRIPENFI